MYPGVRSSALTSIGVEGRMRTPVVFVTLDTFGIMKALALSLLAPFALSAHLVSISTGDLTVDGTNVRYELRVPLYETDYMEDPERELFEQFHLSSAGYDGRRVELSCREDQPSSSFTCNATYTFPIEVERLSVECNYHAVTVPNHVHILRARRGEKTDQTVFDLTARRAEINFIPPTPWQIARQQTGAGARRVVGGLAPMLFLAAIVLASRSRRELLALVGMLLAGEIAATLLLPVIGWQPAPQFVEAAAALTISYLAVEILLLPQAGQRWLVVGVLGVFHGFYLAAFLAGSEYRPGYVLSGVTLAEVALAALFAVLMNGLRRFFPSPRVTQLLAGGLLVFGMGWFFFRLRG